MKTSKKIISIIEWSLAVLLSATCIYYFILSSSVSLSPLKAHKLSERIYHFGPSEVVKTIDVDGGKVYLCRYKNWFSADIVKKKFFVWYPADQLEAYGIDPSDQVSFAPCATYSLEHKHTMFMFGQVNDPNIVSLSLEIGDEERTLKYDIDDSKMFIFYWYQDKMKYKTSYIRGYDKDGKLIYEGKQKY